MKNAVFLIASAHLLQTKFQLNSNCFGLGLRSLLVCLVPFQASRLASHAKKHFWDKTEYRDSLKGRGVLLVLQATRSKASLFNYRFIFAFSWPICKIKGGENSFSINFKMKRIEWSGVTQASNFKHENVQKKRKNYFTLVFLMPEVHVGR